MTVPAEHVDLAARYDQDAIEAVLPAAGMPRADEPQAAARNDVADADMTLIVRQCAWIRHCRDDAAVLAEPE